MWLYNKRFVGIVGGSIEQVLNSIRSSLNWLVYECEVRVCCVMITTTSSIVVISLILIDSMSKHDTKTIIMPPLYQPLCVL